MYAGLLKRSEVTRQLGILWVHGVADVKEQVPGIPYDEYTHHAFDAVYRDKLLTLRLNFGSWQGPD